MHAQDHAYKWVTEAALYVTNLEDPNSPEPRRLLVTDIDRTRAVILSWGTYESYPMVLFNGEFVDVGDDYGVFLGLFDEVAELGPGENLIPAVES
jgi:hypothetical protein